MNKISNRIFSTLNICSCLWLISILLYNSGIRAKWKQKVRWSWWDRIKPRVFFSSFIFCSRKSWIWHRKILFNLPFLASMVTMIIEACWWRIFWGPKNIDKLLIWSIITSTWNHDDRGRKDMNKRIEVIGFEGKELPLPCNWLFYLGNYSQQRNFQVDLGFYEKKILRVSKGKKLTALSTSYWVWHTP